MKFLSAAEARSIAIEDAWHDDIAKAVDAINSQIRACGGIRTSTVIGFDGETEFFRDLPYVIRDELALALRNCGYTVEHSFEGYMTISWRDRDGEKD